MNVPLNEYISLALQFAASLLWAIGASMAGPSSASDIMQLLAAVAWFFANVASAISLNSKNVDKSTKMLPQHPLENVGEQQC